MMSKMFGAPLGGTTCGGHHGLDWSAWRPMLPPNCGGGGGRYLPSIVVVALGEPGTPLVCCATAPVMTSNAMAAITRSAAVARGFIASLLFDRARGRAL